MDQKFQVWLKEISLLTPEQKEQEIKMMKMEIHNLELRLLVFQLVELNQKRSDTLFGLILERQQLIKQLEIGHDSLFLREM